MTATNHALTGALIGLTIHSPWLALPLAFLSHFVLDALPHYDVPGETHEARQGSRTFLWVQLVGGFIMCVAIVMVLALFHPLSWVIAACCAFVATSPDLISLPRFVSVKRTGHDIPYARWSWFERLHNAVQWKTGPIFGLVELVYFGVGAVLLWQFL